MYTTFHYTALVAGDCDSNDNTIHPNAPEADDGVDNNCDGLEATGYSMCSGEFFQGQYFLMCAYPNTQSDAEALCQQHGYDGLASILNQSENDAVQGLGRFITNGVWLSASDVRSENTFLWSTGANMQFSNWFGNHPNVNAFQRQLCDDGFQWYVARGLLYRVVCWLYL